MVCDAKNTLGHASYKSLSNGHHKDANRLKKSENKKLYSKTGSEITNMLENVSQCIARIFDTSQGLRYGHLNVHASYLLQKANFPNYHYQSK